MLESRVDFKDDRRSKAAAAASAAVAAENLYLSPTRTSLFRLLLLANFSEKKNKLFQSLNSVCKFGRFSSKKKRSNRRP